MYFHSLKYTFLSIIRDKDTMFWCLAFPIVLGTIFQFAFGNLAADEQFSAIPVAAVSESFEEAQNCIENTMGDFYQEEFDSKTIMENVSSFDELSFLDITYTTKDEAYRLLEAKKIYGIFEMDMDCLEQPLRLTLSGEMNSDPFYQSILKTFTDHMNAMVFALTETIKENPDSAMTVLSEMDSEMDYFLTDQLGMDEYDEMLNYFFNLLAMTCLYGAVTGFNVGLKNQANLSPLAMRKCVAPSNPIGVLLGDLSAALLFQYLCVLIALAYCMFILKIKFGTQYGFLLIACFIGALTGVSFGFFCSCIGKKAKEEKIGFLFAIIMLLCMLSGMMYGGMRMIIERTVPFINKINMSALICDSFYALVVYPSHERFWTNVISLLIISALMYVAGLLLIRRKKYAAL